MNSLLEQYIKTIITEDYYDGGFDYGGYGGYGGGYGVSDDFFVNIWNAFADPVKAAVANVEKISSKIQKIAKYLVADIKKIIIPGYKADYEQFDREEHERLKNIHNKYKEVFGRVDMHLFTGDAALAAFLYAPHQFITTRILRDAPDAALDVIDAIGGGNPNVQAWTDRIRDFTERFKHYGRFRGGATSPHPIAIGGYKPPKFKHYKHNKMKSVGANIKLKDHCEINNSLILENEIVDKIKNLFLGNYIKKEINSSSIVQSMKKDAIEYVNNYINDLIKFTQEYIKNIRNNKSIFNQIYNKVDINNIQEKELELLFNNISINSTKIIQKMAIDEILNKINQLPGKQSHPLATYYKKGINMIKSL